jgi:hypothetical protein
MHPFSLAAEDAEDLDRTLTGGDRGCVVHATISPPRSRKWQQMLSDRR